MRRGLSEGRLEARALRQLALEGLVEGGAERFVEALRCGQAVEGLLAGLAGLGGGGQRLTGQLRAGLRQRLLESQDLLVELLQVGPRDALHAAKLLVEAALACLQLGPRALKLALSEQLGLLMELGGLQRDGGLEPARGPIHQRPALTEPSEVRAQGAQRLSATAEGFGDLGLCLAEETERVPHVAGAGQVPLERQRV